MFLVRLVRVIPLIAVLGIAVLIFYIIMSFKFTKPKAKQMVLVIFTWVNIAGIIVFALASLYALLEQNDLAFELMISFLITFAVALLITRICNFVFIKHNPSYKFKAVHAETDTLFVRIKNYFKTRLQ